MRGRADKNYWLLFFPYLKKLLLQKCIIEPRFYHNLTSTGFPLPSSEGSKGKRAAGCQGRDECSCRLHKRVFAHETVLVNPDYI